MKAMPTRSVRDEPPKVQEPAVPDGVDSVSSSHVTRVTHESGAQAVSPEVKRASGSHFRSGVLLALLFIAGYLTARFDPEGHLPNLIPPAAPPAAPTTIVPTAPEAPSPSLEVPTPSPPPAPMAPVSAPSDEPMAPTPKAPAEVPVRIMSNAKSAQVLLNGEPVGRVGETLRLPANQTHRLVVTSPKHEDRTIDLEVGDGSHAHPDYFVALQAVPAVLTITARAPHDFKSPRRAEILLDGTSLGEQSLPFVVVREQEGPLAVGLRAPGFEAPADKNLVVEFGSQMEVCFDLAHLLTQVRVVPTPAEAKVYVGNREVDPASIQVTPGLVYAIRVEAEGYRPLVKDIVVESGATYELRATLRPYTYFDITTDPADASLFMNGKRLLDRKVRVQPDRLYFIDARAKGYKPFRASFQAAEGTTEQVQIRMQRKLLPF